MFLCEISIISILIWQKFGLVELVQQKSKLPSPSGLLTENNRSFLFGIKEMITKALTNTKFCT